VDECKPLPSAPTALELAPKSQMYRRKVKLKAKFESDSSQLSFNTLRPRQFQCGFDGGNQHRPTQIAGQSRYSPPAPISSHNTLGGRRRICPLVAATPQQVRIRSTAVRQGLTLVHSSAQPKAFLTLETPPKLLNPSSSHERNTFKTP
jgi:hypothetical protein